MASCKTGTGPGTANVSGVTSRLRSRFSGYRSNNNTSIQDGLLWKAGVVSQGQTTKAGESDGGVSFSTGLCPGSGGCGSAGTTDAHAVRAAPRNHLSELTETGSSYYTDTALFLQEVK